RSLTLEHEGSDPIAASALLGVVDGVEDVVHLPSHKVTYIKVDDERLDSAHLERVIGRTL
ncbi:MAG: hypothetical protein KBT63_00365, partial [Porticoccaceae bacterium]|nr:hypothetical protein [Porticoccaceae bacterium]